MAVLMLWVLTEQTLQRVMVVQEKQLPLQALIQPTLAAAVAEVEAKPQEPEDREVVETEVMSAQLPEEMELTAWVAEGVALAMTVIRHTETAVTAAPA